MRSRRLVIVLLLALASGLAAGWLALNYLRQPNAPIPTAATNVEVVVASRDLPMGHILDVADIKVAQWPGNAVPAGYSSSVDEVLGRGLIQSVAMNEPLLPAKIAVKEAGGGLPIIIPEGMRAVSVRVDEVIQVAGFVGPGTRVDVLVTLEGEAQPDPVTKIVLQNMLVLTSGQIVQRSPDNEPVVTTVVTFLATPEDAEKLVLASTKGRIQLALRNTLDLDSLTTEGARLRALIPSPQRATPARRPVARTQPQPAASRARTIEVFRGLEREEENVEGGGS
ncbi:MAG: Flp pilus assembly protein CpaB [marine benthic group bacterium]|nr:Flp pilus assembly protein CpaB [Gemmatimonadota bacterium]MCL7977648.1 Flp pilus assembly protein CpaB [Gemmatimonadota bacterium]MCL7990598.1 Flp pilus assembly protein CpaB [Gemmatimonadota bacterium]